MTKDAPEPSLEPTSEAEGGDDVDVRETQRLFLEERRSYVRAAHESSKTYDKAILTLAGGGFGFSVLVLKDLLPDYDLRSTWALIVSWVFFAMTLVLQSESSVTYVEPLRPPGASERRGRRVCGAGWPNHDA